MVRDIDVDLFAVGGGWDEGAKPLGIRPIGIEWDMPACRTGRAAGHVRVCADVAAVPTKPMAGKVRGLIASPPCTLFSAAGHGTAKLVIDELQRGVLNLLAGRDVREQVREHVYPVAHAEVVKRNAKKKPDKRWTPEKVERVARTEAFVAALIVEPARYIHDVSPEWVALEQVPEALPVWQTYATALRERGWSAWCGVLNAADYGVPQTRQRAILIASRVRTVQPPAPTHCKGGGADDLFGEALLPWISMATALGWGASSRPSPTITSGGAATGGAEPLARGGRDALERIRREGDWVIDRRTNSKDGRGGMVPTVTVPMDRPAPTLTGKDGGQWIARPAWAFERPSTTVVGSFCPDVIAAPGYRTTVSRQNAEDSVKVTIDEAAALQSFPRGYPWQGTKGKQFEQIGNAVPPLLATHVLASVTGLALPKAVEVAA